MLQSELTICTVAYKSRMHLDLNWMLSDKLNSAAKAKWVVVENTEHNPEEQVDFDDDRFTVMAGVTTQKIGAYGSYNHAAGLNKTPREVTTLYALFMDPDFFIIRPEWIRDVLAYMQARGLSFFGAPYYPDRYYKYRYFPSLICLFVDFERVPKSKLNFSPEINELEAAHKLSWGTLLHWALVGHRPNPNAAVAGLTSEMARYALWARVLAILLGDRVAAVTSVGGSRDTGYRIYRDFSNDRAYLYESLNPSWNNPLYAHDSSLRTKLKRWFLPDSMSIHPKKWEYSTAWTFRDFGLPDMQSQGCEEYFWRGEPFGFHLRGVSTGLRQVDNSLLRESILKFMSHQTVNKE